MSDVQQICEDIHSFADTLGWDQFPMLMLVNDDRSITDIIMLDGPEKPYILVQNLAKNEPEMAGRIRSSDAMVLVSEGWTYPKHILDQVSAGAPMPTQPPSETPGRREVRTVMGIQRGSDDVIGIMRIRGEDELVTDTQMSGPMVSALRYVLNNPTLQASVN